MEAAEIEVEQAALFHAELWYDLLEIEHDSHENSGDEDCEETEENIQATEVNTETTEDIDTNKNNT